MLCFDTTAVHLVVVMLCLLWLLLVAVAVASDGDEVLAKYRLCLADSRGGTYWNENNMAGISCSYITTNGVKEIRCSWDRGGFVAAIFKIDVNASAPTTRKPNCRLARHIELANNAETFTADLDLEVGMPSVVGAPFLFPKWRRWIQWTSPVSIAIREALDAVPDLSDFNKLRTFSLTDSAEHVPKDINGSVFPDLPHSIEEISLSRNKLSMLPGPGNNSFPVLRRLDLSQNRLEGSSFKVDSFPEPMAPVLKELDLSKNLLESLGFYLRNLFPQLIWLDVSHNRILNIIWTYALAAPTGLRFLNVSHNTKSLPNSFESWPELETLDVSYTRPDYSPTVTLAWNLAAPKLKKLYASGFDNILIANVSLDFVKMRMDHYKFPLISSCNIRHLDLSNSTIRNVSNLGHSNTTVEYLDISKNQIEFWPNGVFKTKYGTYWVKHVNVSYNRIRFMSPEMLQSLQSLKSVDIGANPFECYNCNVYSFQTWLKENADIVLDLNKSSSPYCGSPPTMRGTLVSDSDYYWKYCAPDSSLNTGVPVGVFCFFLIAQCVVLYHYRHKIVFIQHLYKLRVRQPKDEAGSCTHDVFICYSSVDRAFVMETLAPCIEGGPERYRAYIHERSFSLGSDIGTNIVEAIERSRRALLVVSQAFLKSEYCKKEYDMVTHRAFDGTPGYMVLLRYGPLKKEALPRPLRLYMTTKTYLEWPDRPDDVMALEVRKRLVTALGRSIYQRAQKSASVKIAREE